MPDQPPSSSAASDPPPLSATFYRHDQQESTIPAPGLSEGKRVGAFRLIRLLGQGGMGQVWEAQDESLARRVAVKFVKPERVTEHQLELFSREARAGGRLSHSGIVAVYGYGESDGLAWIAMELIPGAWDLRNFLDDLARTNEVPEGYDRKVAQFIMEVADAVQAAHEAGVIHRDLKPQNILITEDDCPKVTDFGLARITDESALSVTGDFAGTYFYMSPEQVAARRAGLDHRTDIFSLGTVLYEMLSLQRPFQGDTEHQVAEQILVKDPPDPRTFRSKVPRDLALVAGMALEKDREKRYGTMREFSNDLSRWMANEPVRAKPPTPLDRATKWCRRNPTLAVAGAIGAITIAVIAALYTANLEANRQIEIERASLENSNSQLEKKTSELKEANKQLRQGRIEADMRAAVEAEEALQTQRSLNHALKLADLLALQDDYLKTLWEESDTYEALESPQAEPLEAYDLISPGASFFPEFAAQEAFHSLRSFFNGADQAHLSQILRIDWSEPREPGQPKDENLRRIFEADRVLVTTIENAYAVLATSEDTYSEFIESIHSLRAELQQSNQQKRLALKRFKEELPESLALLLEAQPSQNWKTAKRGQIIRLLRHTIPPRNFEAPSSKLNNLLHLVSCDRDEIRLLERELNYLVEDSEDVTSHLARLGTHLEQTTTRSNRLQAAVEFARGEFQARIIREASERAESLEQLNALPPNSGE